MFDGACFARETGHEYRHETHGDGWRKADRNLRRLAQAQAALHFEEARGLVLAFRTRPDRQLGYGSFSEYLERIFGWSPRLADDKLRVALALEELPQIARALKDGELSWSAVRELTRVAVVRNEADWLAAAGGNTVRQIERMVSGRRRGDAPRDPKRPELEKQVIHVEVSPATMALFREALMMVQKNAGGTITEDDAIQAVARAALGGPKDEGRASYQIIVSTCEDCGRVTQRGRGQELDVDSTVLETAACDAQHLDLRDPTAPPPPLTQEIKPSVRRMVWHRDRGRCVVPGCSHAAYLDPHHLQLRSEGGTHDPDVLVCLCGAHHRQAHEGRLVIRGTVSSGLTFEHADGSAYGCQANADLAGILSEAFDALLALRFPQGKARMALDEVRAHVGGGGSIASSEEAVRMALRCLRKAQLESGSA